MLTLILATVGMGTMALAGLLSPDPQGGFAIVCVSVLIWLYFVVRYTSRRSRARHGGWSGGSSSRGDTGGYTPIFLDGGGCSSGGSGGSGGGCGGDG